MEKAAERSSNQNIPGGGERVNQDREVLELWRQFFIFIRLRNVE
jgi:hypothetical protein